MPTADGSRATTSRFRVATTLARKLEELGVSPANVLREAGLPAGLFDQEKIFVSTDELFALYRGLGQASHDPAIGLKLGTEPRIERYDPIAIAAVSAQSLRDALERAWTLFPILAARRRQLAGTLSGGEQQMLAVAMALLSRPRLLVLDEPSLGLAPLVVDQLYATVARLKREGLTILLVEQQVFLALELADRAYVLETGRIRLEGSGRALLADPHVRETYLGVAAAGG